MKKTMNIEEIENKIKELQEELEKLKKKENKRWRAKASEKYYYITSELDVDYSYEQNFESDDDSYCYHNYFETEEEAQKVADNIKTHIELIELAEELNTEPIDWEDSVQERYCINYNLGNKYIDTSVYDESKYANTIYCTNENFCDEAINRIGEERLIKYLKGS